MKLRKITVIGCVLVIALSFFLTTSFCQERDADKYLEAGRKLYNEGRFEEALKEFVAALQKDPANEEITRYIDKTQMKIKELMAISRALVRDDKIAVRSKDIKDIEIKPSYYDRELKKLAEKMALLIDKTKERAGKTTKEEILERKESAYAKASADKARERLTGVKEYFEEGQKLYDKGNTKEAIAVWEKALAVAKKGGPEIAHFIDTLQARIENEKEAQAETERKAALLAARQEEDVIASPAKRGEAISKKEIASPLPSVAPRKDEEDTRPRKDGEKAAPRKNGLIIGVIGLLLLLFIVKIIARSKAKPHLAKEPPKKIFEQAKPKKGLFQARKLRDAMGKKKTEKDENSSNNGKRKNLFEKDE